MTKKTQKNPKSHDALFKWLIASFTDEFFAHYFPDIKIGKYTFIDKEFISKYEALKESLKGDIFIAMELEIDDKWQDVVIHTENEGHRSDIGERIYEYHCYAWLLKKKPVWSIVVYTDDAVWQKPVSDTFFYGFNSRCKKLLHQFDVIKIKEEKSSDLICKKSLMCKLLALKANDKDTNPKELVYEILKTVSDMQNQLTDDIKLLVLQWVDLYKKVSVKTLDTIKKEVNMDHIATTITEHYKLQGMAEGKAAGLAEGEARGEARGEVRGKTELLQSLYKEGMLTEKQYQKMLISIKL